MPASQILSLITTVATIQALCDVAAYWLVFRGEKYQRLLGRLESAQWKAKKAADDLKKASTTKNKERLEKNKKRVDDDLANCQAAVASKHTAPNVLTSIVFLMLMRILGSEHQGEIIGVLPFAPLSFVQRITRRGLTALDDPHALLDAAMTTGPVTHLSQACTFMSLYFLVGLSVKYYTHQLLGQSAPLGADNLMSIADSPMGHKILRNFGLDPNELKAE